MEIIKAVSLKKIYINNDIEVRALDGIDLSIEEGEFVAVIGTSGSGKSTLLNILGGLDYPTEGFVAVKEETLNDMNIEELAIFRRRNIGFIFQNYNLVLALNVYENIVLPIKVDGRVVDVDFVEGIIEELEIKPNIYQMPSELSGGQQQRVAIARALVTRPAIILADEPTGNLDSKTSKKVIELMKDIASKFNQTMAIITHDEKVANMAKRIIHIEDGKIF